MRAFFECPFPLRRRIVPRSASSRTRRPCRGAASASLVCLLTCGISTAHAQTGLLSHNAADFASGKGNIAYLGLGVLLPLVTDGANGTSHTLRTADALLTSTVLSEGLKMTFHERRPDGSTLDSFPSGHATAAFAVATMEAHYHRTEAPFWYLGAAIIADSRVTLHRHYPHDVIAGGLLGVGTALLELKEPRGLVLSPIIRQETKAQSLGCLLGYSRSF